MYKCDKCGMLVDELPKQTDNIGNYGNEPQYEEIEIDNCECGGYYCEAIICQTCGDYQIESDFKDTKCKYCDDVVMTKLERVLRANFTVEEIQYIYDNWEM